MVSQLHKAAVFLRSLPEPQASRLLERLGPRQAAAAMAEMQRLETMDAGEQESVIREFTAANAERPSNAASEPVAGPFDFLDAIEADAIVEALADEHPQTIALVLVHLPAQHAAAILANLSADEQLPVICRLATMGQPAPEAIRDVQTVLRQRLLGREERPEASRGVASVIRMLNAMEPVAERQLLAHLSRTAPDLLREIRRVMFGVDVDPMPDESPSEWTAAAG